MKTCFKCGLEKPLSEFYKHDRMGDGHLNKCKECTKSDMKRDYHQNRESAEWMNKERLRGREKYRKYKYKSNGIGRMKWAERFPEKIKAKNNSSHVSCPKGFEKHHWSYNQEHWKDVIFLSNADHNFLHRYLVYDPSSMYYKTLEGRLLDTREKHEMYFKAIKEAMAVEL